MTSPPLARVASIAAGRMFTSVPSDTHPSTGVEVWMRTMSGGSDCWSRWGTSDSREGK
ncbi:hypothetical protein [Saccharothrix longispora]|uniref:hypothetical protein n=1 Tax=Saccharothrix longispora TaxID=33920 RepID=UPI0031EA9B7F